MFKTKRFLAILLAALFALGMVPLGATTAHAATDITAAFTDPNFRAAVYSAIGKWESEPIYDTDVAWRTELSVNGRGIQSLAGLEHFTGLKRLCCESNQLTTLPTLPSGLEELGCGNNQLTVLPILPSRMEVLDCWENQLASLPALPSGLEDLDCSDNLLTSLPALPSGLETLNCNGNQLTSMPTLPSGLSALVCESNLLTSLPTLPSGLKGLICSFNPLTSLPALPSGLTHLLCYCNQLTSLPTLPSELEELHCRGNQLTTLPTLPIALKVLICADNQLTSINVTSLPLKYLHCYNNNMTSPSDVIGFSGTWDDNFFKFYPQNTITPTTYTLTLNANGGNVTPTTVTQATGTTYTLPTPTRNGYTFNGWTLSGGGSLSGSTYTFGTSNGTVTAGWTQNTVLTDPATGIKVSGILGGAALVVEEKPAGSYSVGGAAAVLKAYDIRLEGGNGTVGDITVQIPIPQGKSGLKVYYIDDNNNPTIVPSREEGGYLVFTVSHFSIYAIAEGNSTDAKQYFKLWGKETKWEKNIWNWILLIVCFGWVWMAF